MVRPVTAADPKPPPGPSRLSLASQSQDRLDAFEHIALERSRDRQRARFWISAGLVATTSAAFIIWMAVGYGGLTLTLRVDDIGEAIAALVAAATCSWAAS